MPMKLIGIWGFEMNLSYEKMVQLASAGLKAGGIGEKAAFETAQFLALAELDGLA